MIITIAVVIGAAIAFSERLASGVPGSSEPGGMLRVLVVSR